MFLYNKVAGRRNSSQKLWYLLGFRNIYIEWSLMLLDDICWSHSFFLWYCYYFTVVLEVIHMTRALWLFDNTCCNHPYYYKRSVIDLTKTEWCVYLRKAIVALLFSRYLFIPQNLCCCNICLKSVVLNARKYLQLPVVDFTRVIAAIN